MRSPLSSLRILAALLMCCSAFAQTSNPQSAPFPATTQDVIRVDTALVQTDVTVLDAQGRPVNGLQSNQFELKVEGRVVPIEFFDRSSPGSEASARKIVFFVDDFHLNADSLGSIRAGLLNFVSQEMKTNDQVAVVSASGQIGFLQQFSDNQGMLRLAISRIKPRANVVHDSENVAMSEYVAYRISQGDSAALNFYTNEFLRSLQFNYALPKYGGKGAGYRVGGEPDQAQRMVVRRAEAIIAQSIPLSLRTLSALENFLRTTAGMGRKTVFFISDGFLMHGRNGELNRAAQRVNDAASLSNSVIYSVDSRAFTHRRQATLMKVDSLGRPDDFARGELEALQAGARSIAEATNGKVIVDAKSLTAAVDDGLRESGNYYRIAWRPESEAQKVEKFRNLSISIVGRPDLKPRLSAAYAVSATGKSSRQMSTARPALIRSSSMVLPTRLSVSFLNTPGNGNVITASTRVTIDPSAFVDEKPTTVDLAGLIYDETGQLAADFQKQLTVHPLGGAAPPENTNVIYNHRTSLKPGVYQVKIAAKHPESGRMGLATEWIEIPDVDREAFLLSSILLEATTKNSAKDNSPQFQQNAGRVFSRSSRLNFLVFVYNGAGEGNSQPDLKAQMVVVQNGRPVLTIPSAKVPVEMNGDLRRIPFGGSFPISALAPGRYHLGIAITDQKAQRLARQQIEFEVE